MDQGSSSEKKTDIMQSVERPRLIVEQPQKLGSLLETLSLIESISERISEGRSGDWSGSLGGGTKKDDSGQQTQVSVRDQAIANLPSDQEMQRLLKRHIIKEVKQLERRIKAVSHLSRKPGSAHKLNELYAMMRRLNKLLAEIFEASYEVIKRLFVRVVIDKQSIVN